VVKYVLCVVSTHKAAAACSYTAAVTAGIKSAAGHGRAYHRICGLIERSSDLNYAIMRH